MSPECPAPRSRHQRPRRRKSFDFRDDIGLRMIENNVGAHALGHIRADGIGFDGDDQACTLQFCARCGTDADWALGKHGNRVADLTSALSAAEIPVDAMSANRTTCSSHRSLGIFAKLACA